MITEDYCSDEVSKLLREKGFNEPVTELNRLLFKEGKKPVLKITLQKAMKWLRESHNLYIEPYVIKNYNNKKLEYTYSIQDLDFNGSDDGIECCKNWNSPEKACEAAIKYCLENLI